MTNDVKAGGDWGAIDELGRLTVPSQITGCLSWFTPKKRMRVSIDLSRPKMIVIRHLPEVLQLLEDRRQTLLEDSEDLDTGMRRVAMTHYFFQEATLVV